MRPQRADRLQPLKTATMPADSWTAVLERELVRVVSGFCAAWREREDPRHGWVTGSGCGVWRLRELHGAWN